MLTKEDEEEPLVTLDDMNLDPELTDFKFIMNEPDQNSISTRSEIEPVSEKHLPSTLSVNYLLYSTPNSLSFPTLPKKSIPMNELTKQVQNHL